MIMFICIYILKFISLYKIKKLIYKLTRFEIDAHNIIIKLIFFQSNVFDFKLLQACL